MLGKHDKGIRNMHVTCNQITFQFNKESTYILFHSDLQNNKLFKGLIHLQANSLKCDVNSSDVGTSHKQAYCKILHIQKPRRKNKKLYIQNLA